MADKIMGGYVLNIIHARHQIGLRRSLCQQKLGSSSGYSFEYLQNYVAHQPKTITSYKICPDCAVIVKLMEGKDDD